MSERAIAETVKELLSTGNTRELVRQYEANVSEVSQYAIDAMRFHGLVGWRLRFMESYRTIGNCSYHKKEIALSYQHSACRGTAGMKNTILHEITHALVGHCNGEPHGHEWKRVARSIGCTGDRCADFVDAVPKRWEAECVRGHRWYAHEKGERGWGYCGQCRRELEGDMRLVGLSPDDEEWHQRISEWYRVFDPVTWRRNPAFPYADERTLKSYGRIYNERREL